ncbi:MAG: ion transporter [Nitrospirae bacterium]|nr:ion transporter [Nitrospirota bacterium]
MALIHPDGKFRQRWDFVVIVATVVSSVEIPLRITLNYPLKGWLVPYDYVVTLIFLADVVVNFLTQQYDKKKLISDPKVIAGRYLRGWFVVDFLSAVPFDLLFSGVAAAGSNRILRLLRITRLLRLTRLAAFLSKWGRGSSINPAILRMFYLVFWILMTSHFVACLWIYFGSGNAVNTNTDYAPTDNLRNYVRALYWVTTTLTTIGYGDITPVNNRQTVFTMIIQLMGAGMYGFVIGNIANLIANIDIAKSQFRERMEKIETFMRYKAVPPETQDRVREYYNYLWESRRGYDEFSIVNDFPTPLRTEILLFLNRSMIEKVPIFKGATPDFVREIVLNLKPVVFSPSEFVFRKGDIGYNMYFISRGGVEVTSEDGKTIYATLREGNFFGEIALLLSMPRTASIRAIEFTDLYELDKDTFDRVLGRFPDFEKHMRELARQRQEEMQKDKK